jgi:hypothetical protein
VQEWGVQLCHPPRGPPAMLLQLTPQTPAGGPAPWCAHLHEESRMHQKKTSLCISAWLGCTAASQHKQAPDRVYSPL